MSITERAGTTETLTTQVRTQTATGFEKHAATWGTDTTVGSSGTVTGSLLDAGAREMERAEARGEVVDKVLVTPYPVGVQAERHRFRTSGGTKYRVKEVRESTRRGLYLLAEDTT